MKSALYNHHLMKLIVTIFLFFALSIPVDANNSQRLTVQQVERLEAVNKLLRGVDGKSLPQMISELEKSDNPQMTLAVKEAIAKAYIDIVSEVKVEGQKKKEWLYSMVCLNMAYLQFGGDVGKSGSTTSLNRLIRQKLKKYLPQEILKEKGFSHSLE